MLEGLDYEWAKMLHCGRDTKCFYLAGEPVDLMFPQLSAKEPGEVYLALARQVKCGAQASLGDRAIRNDP